MEGRHGWCTAVYGVPASHHSGHPGSIPRLYVMCELNYLLVVSLFSRVFVLFFQFSSLIKKMIFFQKINIPPEINKNK
jgi:hypothetical protein